MKIRLSKTSSITKLFIFLIIAGLAFSTGGCKSKKKLAEEAAAKEYAEKVENAIAELNAILSDDGSMPITEKERRLNDIKSQNLNDAKVNELITQVEAKIEAEKEAERLKKQQEEQKRLEMEEKTKYVYIDEYFNQIAGSASPEEANAKIAEVLKLFASNDVPVLIIVSQSGDITDYDKPTTIEKYLNYLKDTKNYNNHVYDVRFDDYGQIVSLELKKN